jgi:hypothetical protein
MGFKEVLMKKFVFSLFSFLSVFSMEERCVRVYNRSDQSNPIIFISGFSPNESNSSSGSETSCNSSVELPIGKGKRFYLAGGFELMIKRRLSQEDAPYLVTYRNKSDVEVIHLVSTGIRVFRSSKARYSPY